jgi:hypothetical protein
MQEIGEFSKKVKEKNKVRLKAKHHDPWTGELPINCFAVRAGLEIQGNENAKRIPMKPKQWIEVIAVATRHPEAPIPCQGAPVLIDVSQQLDGKTVGGLTLAVQPSCKAKPSGKDAEEEKQERKEKRD